MPRSQLVPPAAVNPLMRSSSGAASAAVVTGLSGKLALMAPAAGASLANVNSATLDGVPSSASTNATPALLYWARYGATEPDRSNSSATLSPQRAGSGG